MHELMLKRTVQPSINDRLPAIFRIDHYLTRNIKYLSGWSRRRIQANKGSFETPTMVPKSKRPSFLTSSICSNSSGSYSNSSSFYSNSSNTYFAPEVNPNISEDEVNVYLSMLQDQMSPIMPSFSKSVVVVGAGLAGLAAARECRKAGMDAHRIIRSSGHCGSGTLDPARLVHARNHRVCNRVRSCTHHIQASPRYSGHSFLSVSTLTACLHTHWQAASSWRSAAT